LLCCFLVGFTCCVLAVSSCHPRATDQLRSLSFPSLTSAPDPRSQYLPLHWKFFFWWPTDASRRMRNIFNFWRKRKRRRTEVGGVEK
jgi:hypothetical protein